MSVVDALQGAFERTRAVCFSPFRAERWLWFGLAAFLATCGEGAGGSTPGGGGGGGGDGDDGPWSEPSGAASEALRFLSEHGTLVAALVAGAFVLLLAWVAVTTWISSRGKLVFVDGIARNELRLGAAWREYADEGNALFVLRLVLGVGVALLLFGLAVGVAVPVLRWIAGQADVTQGLAIVLPAAAAIGFVVVLAGLAHLVIDDLLVPTLVLRRDGIRGAWDALRGHLGARPGAFALYLLIRIILGAVASIVLGVLGIVTCCIGFLPLVSHVLFVPVYVFVRSFSLSFLAQLGPEWSVFDTLGSRAAATADPADLPDSSDV